MELFAHLNRITIMGRRFRANLSNCFYHVMARGDNREPIFRDDGDRQSFLGILKRTIEMTRFEVHAYCLMTNHFHLLMRSSTTSLSRFMERLQGLYARTVNWKHDRIGHVFQGRYLAKIVSNNAYLMEVGRYIHMNPVIPKLTERPEEYLWSSFRDYVELRDTWIVRKTLLEPFAGPNALMDFYGFTTARQDIEIDEAGWPKGTSWYDVDKTDQPLASPDWPGESRRILHDVARYFDVEVATITNSARHPRHGLARAIAALALHSQTPLALKEIAAHLGMRTAQGVCLAISKATKRLGSDKKLQEIVKALRLGQANNENLGQPKC